MKRRAVLAVAALGLCFAVRAAELPEKWRAWRYSRQVSVGNAQAGPAEIRLPWEVVTHCAANCGDIRLIDGQGQEVPYEPWTDKEAVRPENHAASIVENSFVVGKYTQVVGDLGEAPPNFDRVRVETDESDFIEWAEVALSDDAKTWRVVEARAPIARFRKRSVDGTQTIPFQGLPSRYIRVRIFSASRQFAVTGLSVLHEETHPVEFAEVPANFQPVNTADSAESAWSTTMLPPHVPIAQVRFATETPEFYRAVRISVSADGKEWTYRGSGVIYRYIQDGKPRESLKVDFYAGEQPGILRVEVINGNDQPLQKVQLSLFAVPRRILFKPQAGASYRLLYDNEKAAAPQYDLGHYLESGPSKPLFTMLALGPEEVTTNFRDPRPFTERHPELLWASLGVAIVLIGLTALKTLRSSPQGPRAS